MWNAMKPPDNGNMVDMYRYFGRVFKKVPSLPPWKPFAVQAFWQQAWHLTSNVLAEVRPSTDLNKLLVEYIKHTSIRETLGTAPQSLGALEINFICESGLSIATQIAGLPGAMTSISTSDRAACITACIKAEEFIRMKAAREAKAAAATAK